MTGLLLGTLLVAFWVGVVVLLLTVLAAVGLLAYTLYLFIREW